MRYLTNPRKMASDYTAALGVPSQAGLTRRRVEPNFPPPPTEGAGPNGRVAASLAHARDEVLR